MASTLFEDPNHASLYSKFRQSPPLEFIESIADYVKKQLQRPLHSAADLGCGSGQSTAVLAPHFQKVYGLDSSEAQIQCARNDRSGPNLEYRVSDCAKLPFPDSSLDLVTFCQSVHWFPLDSIFEEVRRVLVPKGVISAYSYWIPIPKVRGDERKSGDIYRLITKDLYEEALGKYWTKERRMVKRRYEDLTLPFQDVHRLSLERESQSTVADYMNYLRTWGPFQLLRKEDPQKAVEAIENVHQRMRAILEEDKPSEEIVLNLHTDFFMVMGHC